MKGSGVQSFEPKRWLLPICGLVQDRHHAYRLLMIQPSSTWKCLAHQQVDCKCGHARRQADVLLQEAEEGVRGRGIDAEIHRLQHNALHPQQILHLRSSHPNFAHSQS